MRAPPTHTHLYLSLCVCGGGQSIKRTSAKPSLTRRCTQRSPNLHLSLSLQTPAEIPRWQRHLPAGMTVCVYVRIEQMCVCAAESERKQKCMCGVLVGSRFRPCRSFERRGLLIPSFLLVSRGDSEFKVHRLSTLHLGCNSFGSITEPNAYTGSGEAAAPNTRFYWVHCCCWVVVFVVVVVSAHNIIREKSVGLILFKHIYIRNHIWPQGSFTPVQRYRTLDLKRSFNGRRTNGRTLKNRRRTHIKTFDSFSLISLH